MKRFKLIRNIFILFTALLLFITPSNRANAITQIRRDVVINKHLKIVAILDCTTDDKGHINQIIDKQIYLEGISGMKATKSSLNIEFKNYGNGAMSIQGVYTMQLEGSVSFALKSEFERAGFTVSGGLGFNVNVYGVKNGRIIFHTSSGGSGGGGGGGAFNRKVAPSVI